MIPYYLHSQLPWVITQVQNDKICWSLLCKSWLFKRGYNYSYLTEKSALTTFREVAVSERWSLSRGAYTKVWFDFSETHSQDFIFNPFTPLTPVTAHIDPCPLCHLWHHQFQTTRKRKRRSRAKERMRNVKGEVKPKNCFDIIGFLHMPELGSWYLEWGAKDYDMINLWTVFWAAVVLFGQTVTSNLREYLQ